LIRNSRWTFDAEQFQQSLALLNCCLSLVYVCVCISNQQVFTPLYRGVKDTLEIASTSKRVVWSLIRITNDLLPDMVIVYKGSISNSFQVWRDTGAGIAVCLVFLQGQNRVVEIVVVHFTQLSFVNSLQRKSIQCLQIHLN